MTKVVAYMLTAALGFTVMASAAKAASVEVSPPIVVLVRSVVIVLLTRSLLWARGAPVRFVATRSLWIRDAAGLSAMLAYFWAIAHGELGAVVAIQYTSPFFVALLAPRVLGELVSRRSWAALAMGFAGAVVLLRPEGGL